MHEFELSYQDTLSPLDSLAKKGLADGAIMQNASWFVTLRWFVVSAFVLFGLLGLLLRTYLERIHVAIPYWWLWALAAILLIANIPLHLITKRFGESTTRKSVLRNLWVQIILDLIVVTAVVYNIGTVETFAAFTYLFHIVLACIFFPPRQSLLVTCAAAVLFLLLVFLETMDILPTRGILTPLGKFNTPVPIVRLSLAFFGVLIWIIVWYITSTLSKTVRRRDQQLSVANDQLILADEEKNRQMLITTHDLKAPFAGIESNIQVLKYQYWEEIPESMRGIIERIDNRAHMLRDRINAILILGNLKSLPVAQTMAAPVDLKTLVEQVIDNLREKAELRKVSIETQISPVEILADREQLSMLLSNLVANAISYSREKGTVHLTGAETEEGFAFSIRDEGIGIREDALPEIFDEYYRTQEATRFNRQSTGLGLAIVKVIAQKFNLKVRVDSEIDIGTNFTVIFPRYKVKKPGG